MYCFTKLLKINKKIVIAPLDWGLGHATRCIPIVKALTAQNIAVIVAGTAETHALFTAELIDFEPLLLPGYQILYKKKWFSHRLYLLMQIPKLKKIIQQEHNIIEDYCTNNNIDTVISDNRYGAYYKKGYNIFITHQLEIQTGLGAFFNRLIQKMHYNKLSPFAEIWVPDFKDAWVNLSGKLSHTVLPNTTVRYIGPLSRFSLQQKIAKKFACCFIISGPEPYKLQFIKEALALAVKTKQPIAIITGNVLKNNLYEAAQHVTIYNHLSTIELRVLIQVSEFVVCRSGYSSIMDLAALQAKAVLIPTPSQTEQQYLAAHVKQHCWAVCIQNLKHETLETLQQKVAEHNFVAWPTIAALNLPLHANIAKC
jgi:predicted glycosyltransferase